jgi:hypothetical protein
LPVLAGPCYAIRPSPLPSFISPLHTHDYRLFFCTSPNR